MRVVATLLSIGLAGYAAAAVASGLDQMSANVWTLERLVPRPFRAEAFRSAAELAMIDGRAEQARSLASEAVWHDPANHDSVATLASAYQLEGDSAKADEAFRVAARFGWRNLSTQAYWYRAALDSGDYSVAADRADAILRLEPSIVNRQDILEPLETTPEARPFLLARIRDLPDWVKYDYLTIFNLDDADIVSRRVTTVAAASPLGCDEVTTFVKALLQKGRREDAARIWNANCPRARVNGLVADPAFANLDLSKSPFGWTVVRTGDVSVSPALAGRGVEVRNTAATTRQILSQGVGWPAGSYRVRLAIDGDRAAAADRFGFSLGCGGRQPFPRPSAGDPVGAGAVVQSEGCAAGTLALWMKPGAASVMLRGVEVEKLD